MKSIFLTKKLPVNFILYENNTLEVFNSYITFSLQTEAENNSKAELEVAQKNQNISFSRISTFLDSIVNDSIVIERHDPALSQFSSMINNIIMLPKVADMVLVSALHAKLNSIILPNSFVSQVTINDIREDMTFEYHAIDEDYDELPSNESWCPEFSYWDTPWWFREDIITYDSAASDISNYHEWLNSGEKDKIESFSVMLFDEINEQFDKLFDSESRSEPGMVIDVDFSQKKFVPKLVD